MRKKGFIACIFILFAMFFLMTSEVLPRAGQGQKYKPPPRRRTTRRRRTPSRRRTRTPRYGATVTRTTPGYRSTRRYDDDRYDDTRSRSRSRGDSEGACACLSCASLPCIIGVVVLVGIIAIIIYFVRKGKKEKEGGQAPQNQATQQRDTYVAESVGIDELPPIDRAKVEEQLASLKEKDPNFSEKIFLDKAQTIFYEIQRAWSKGDLEPVRGKMSESQFKRMKMQLDELHEKGLQNKVEDIVVGKIEVTEAGVEGEHDFIKVLINCSMSDKTVDQQGNIVEGGNEIQNVLEYWTFVRKMGAKTAEDGGKTVAHNCPNCGAPIDQGEVSKCPYCETTITSSSFDWVMDSITQGAAVAAEYDPGADDEEFYDDEEYDDEF